MRKLPCRLLILCGVGATLFGAMLNAHAQGLADANPPLPNILLIVDTSGSMERKSQSQDQPTCDPTGASASQKSRWIETVEVLTGSIQDYRCQSVSRSSTSFKDEYSILGNLPYDFNYVNAYHRPLSGTCTPGPGVLPSPNAYDYPVGSIKYHPYTSLNTTCNTFSQTADGILDTFGGLMRFGLMTFDTLPSKETGVSGTVASYATGMQGTWSYFINTAAATGRPELCTTAPLDIEVGARNAAAPPWEGRMVAFGDPAADSAAVLARNSRIQEILLATRPFGATPIAGVMQDARDLLWDDTSTDPLNNALNFGPGTDPFIRKGCREQSIILLTDGEPNLDLRPACEGAGPPAGKCPYEKPETTALALSSSISTTQRPAKTYVVGFALSTVTVGAVTKDCTTFTDDDLTGATGLCNNVVNKDNVNLQACCTLNRIAFSGGTAEAYFASDKNALGLALSKILQQATTTTTRTHPAFSSAASSAGSPGFRFFSSYQPAPANQVQLPDGKLERQRYTCDNPANMGKPMPEDITLDKGDDFSANLNSAAADARVFLSVEVDADGAGDRWSDRSVRPSITTDVDGVASYRGTQYGDTAAIFVSSTLPASMQLPTNTDDCLGLSDLTCRDRVLKWLVGLNNGSNQYHRCESPGDKCHLMGDILHSTPALVNRPLAFLRDESYQAFADAKAKRPLTLYVSTNDGLLHAFRVASNEVVGTAEKDPVNSLANNEMWAFIPPAVLPLIQSEYPPTQVRLLDGSPVVKDVVAKKQADDSYVFERTSADAQAGTGDWRTVLVQSFGPGAAVSGYFALDITDPVVTSSSKPKFLWQLTVAGNQDKLFGPGTAKPLITTVFYDGNADGEPEEVPVAVLPGGDGVSAGPPCARAASATNIDTNFPGRTTVNCYPSPQPGRSLTIVRLDTGKIIRTFRRDATDAPAALTTSGVVIPANLDAPIVGEPVAFPSTTGAVADRIFVGDKEGGLWKIDLAATNPDAWTMKLFFDGFPGGTLAHVAADGKPVSTPPILSVDDVGNVTVTFSTGDQEVFTYAAGVKNYVWSLTEKFNGTALESKVNWYQTFNNGERVTGPLTLFNRNLYFSSFLPDDGGGGECALGKAYVWGMDYVLPDANNAAGSGGRDALKTNIGLPAVIGDKLDVSTTLTNSTRTSIFGVGIAQEPTCFDEVTASSQDSLGFGSRTSVTNVNPGKFQLVVQTGAGGEKVEGGSTNALTIDLPPPALRSVIDSWAAIVE